MQLNHIAVTLVFVSMVAFVAQAENSSQSVVLSGLATTSPAVFDETVPSLVFLDWRAVGGENIFEMYMPWGINGSSVELLSNDVVVATSSLTARTPFAQRATFSLRTPEDGMYQYQVKLCTNSMASVGCRLSPEVALSVREGRVALESSLPADEQTLERIVELKEKQLQQTALLIEAETMRMRGLVPTESKELQRMIMHAESNVERIRRLITTDVRRMLFAPTNSISRAAFFEVAKRFPAFCNESNGVESLDDACARELAAVVTYITYYTSMSNTNIRAGMQNPLGAISFLGNDAARFTQVFPGEEDTLPARMKEHPDDALLAIFWWYMSPQSPEPDPHSALLGVWQPNSIDTKRRIFPGFGATINIATHGESCRGGSIPQTGNILRTLYREFLAGFGIQDTQGGHCEMQHAFAIGGSAFLPQYWEFNERENACERSFKENNFFIQDPSSGMRCASPHEKVMATSSAVLQASARKAAITLHALIDRIGLGVGLHSKEKVASDKRTGLGAAIVGTYPYWRGYASDTQPEHIPFSKINSVFLEAAYPGPGGELVFYDRPLLADEFFAGDCFREECARGLFHQFALAKSRYPKVNYILSIGGWDGSSNFSKLSDANKRKKFVDEVRALLIQHPEINGVDINWMYPSTSLGNDFVNPGGDKETMRRILLELRDMENALYINDGVSRQLSIGVGATEEFAKAADLGRVVSLVDLVHLISYDLHGPWDKATGHGAQLFATNIEGDTMSVANAITSVRKAGVPAKKLIIGIPFYGRMWNAVPAGTNPVLPGLHSVTNATSSASLIDYRTIAQSILGKGAYQYYEDVLRGAAYLYDGERFISYDAPEMIEKKMQYVWQDGFGGVLLADIVGDDGTLQDRVLGVIEAQSEKKLCRLSRKPERNLATNSRGADVFALQTFLSCLGSIPEHIDINGNYGPATEEGVMRFQKAEGLEVTGVVGRETRERLSKY